MKKSNVICLTFVEWMGKKSWLYAYTGAVLSPRKKAFLKRFEKAAQIHEVAD